MVLTTMPPLEDTSTPTASRCKPDVCGQTPPEITRGRPVTLSIAALFVICTPCLRNPASTGSRHFYPAEFPLSGLFFHGQQRLKMCKMQMEHPKRSVRRTGGVVYGLLGTSVQTISF